MACSWPIAYSAAHRHSALSACCSPATGPNGVAQRTRGSARSMPAHGRLIHGNVFQGGGPHYRASPGLVWSDMVHVDCPSRRPHGLQCVCSGSSGVTMMRRARSVAREEVAGGWTIGGKVSTSAIHGPRRTCLTRLRAPPHSEEGGRWRCGAHRHGRRHRSSMSVKVSVLWVRVQLQALAKLLDLCTGREEG
jgi:hypothetical protein